MVDAAGLTTEVDGIGPVVVGRPGQTVHAVSILIVGINEALLVVLSICGITGTVYIINSGIKRRVLIGVLSLTPFFSSSGILRCIAFAIRVRFIVKQHITYCIIRKRNTKNSSKCVMV